MVEFDSVDEILEFAIARELEANQLYTALAERMPNPVVRKMFEELAEEELEHKAKLELEVMKEGRVVVAGAVSGFEISDYVADVESVPDMDYKDVLIFGMKKERNALRLYIDLAAIVESKDSREMLLSLAEEEATHVARFEMEYNNVMLKDN
jgi:rubrerythrin